MPDVVIGRVVGKSAYEIAVENGFIGTETEWLESLKGNDGETADLSEYYTKEEVDVLIEEIGIIEGPAGADGKSAYEIAAANGFVGTEEEWLLSLKGVDGRDGQDGEAGYTPIKGTDYFDGDKGDPFRFEDFTPEQLETLKGEPGRDGLPGEKGEPGESPVVEAGKGLSLNGGIIDLVNTKDGTPVGFWLGTLAEYEAIAEKDESVIYNVIEDDANAVFFRN